ncbi:MAG: hypothetical protein HUU20_12755 [Pirellulales bacterium]|nr:hypothetical protein [Pirellulales bacterium]
MAEHYYTEEITAVGYRTLLKGFSAVAPAPLALALAAFFRLRGLLRWPLKPMYASGGVGSEREVARDGLPPRALSRWAPIIEQLADLGFSPLRYSLADVIGQKQQAAALFLDGPGSTIATLEWIRMRGGQGIEEKTPLELNSYAREDPEIMTASVAKEDLMLGDLLQLDFVDTLLLPNHVRLDEVYRRHLARTEGRFFYRMTPEAALKEHRARTQRRFSWALEQGFVRPLTPAEVSRVRELQLE